MSLAELLSYYTEKKNINYTHLAEYLGIDRSTLYKYMKGKRAFPSENILKEIATYLRLNNEETKQLLEAYEVDTTGEFVYYRRKHIEEFFKEADHAINQVAHISNKIELREDSLENDVYSGTLNVEHVLYSLYASEAKEEHPHVRIMEQPYTLSVVLKSFIQLNAKIPITHLFCLDNTQKETQNHEFYNLICLNNLLPIIMFNNYYNAYYYYSNVAIINSHDLFFPNVMITTHYVFTYTNDHSQGILYKKPQIVSAYKEQFDSYQRNASLFMERVSWNDYFTNIKMFGADLNYAMDIFTTPCPTNVFLDEDEEILRECLKDFFPYKDEFIQSFMAYVKYWNEVFLPAHKDIYHTIYTYQGLLYFTESGYFHDIPAELFNPLSLENRLTILERWRQFVIDYPSIQMADMPYFPAESTTYFLVCNHDFNILFSDPTGTLASITIKEATLVEAFEDFLENVVKKNVYSKEDEIRCIDECIEKIKKEL